MASSMDRSEASTIVASAVYEPPHNKSPTTFLDLPPETQQDIISHCSQSDLICVALVSKHFHELASAQLYRNFHIIFPDEDDLNFDSPIDGLAGGLDTFTTSNYNYAKHLKDLSMDTLSSGTKGENAYQPYLYTASCGKFLNTLLYLTLKKAKSLEVFRWNIRVELSRPVYRELHKIGSLKKLHIRMQAGESYYLPPPPLPVALDPHMAPGPSNHWTELPPPMLVSLLNGPPGPTPPIMAASPPPFGSSSKSLPKSRIGKRGPGLKDPSTLSAFKNLKSLSVLDIDDLDIVTELNTCIKNSSATITELQLSLSDSLALQARKPPPDSDPDDSDVDDEFQVIPVSQTNTYDSTGPAKAFRAQEERKVQEAVLSRIFDIDPSTNTKADTKGAPDGSNNSLNDKEKDKDKEGSGADPREEFFSSLKYISTKLMTLTNGSRAFSASQQEILDTIEKAARKYVESSEVSTQKNGTSAFVAKGTTDSTVLDETSGPPADGDSAPRTLKDDADSNVESSASTASFVASQSNSNPTKSSRGKDEVLPDDIDIEHVDGIEDAFEEIDDPQQSDVKSNGSDESTAELDQMFDETSLKKAAQPAKIASESAHLEETGPKESLNDEGSNGDLGNVAQKLSEFHLYANTISEKLQELRVSSETSDTAENKEVEAQLQTLNKGMSDIEDQIKIMQEDIKEAERRLKNGSDADVSERFMKQYVRDTRGLSLTNLSIHLVPVRASVLSKAINFSSLRQLTLLNVGNQAPIWNMLAKENKIRPLPLRSIFTDSVSNAFLTCASQLEELHELLLLERSVKYKPESFAPRTTTTMDQIRRLVLKKHIGTLKRLMIKDESTSSNWDTNEKTMVFICNRGLQLEELAVSMNIHAVHAFMQYFSGLVNLRAINILHFRNNDTCIWVVREILRFIVDNLSHHPELKLEWIAMEDDRVDRVIRPVDSSGTSKSEKKNKSKLQPASTVNIGNSLSSAFPLLPAEGLDSESESDDESFDTGTRLRFKTVGPLQFYDVWGVKIFEKEIRNGRL